jgi:nicotinic acid mononucleotide adenylyltransferase
MRASVEDRLIMMELALRDYGDSRMKIFDYEIRNKLEAGTYAIIKRLLNDDRYKEQNFGFLMGIDQAENILHWRNGRRFKKLLPVVVVGRYPTASWVPPFKWFRENPHEYITSEINKPLSSTQIRFNIKKKNWIKIEKDCGPLIHRYIKEKHLYENKSATKDIDLF